MTLEDVKEAFRIMREALEREPEPPPPIILNHKDYEMYKRLGIIKDDSKGESGNE